MFEVAVKLTEHGASEPARCRFSVRTEHHTMRSGFNLLITDDVLATAWWPGLACVFVAKVGYPLST